MEKIDVFLLIGQSNARGVGNPKESEIPNENCFEYLKNGEIINMTTTLESSEGDGTISKNYEIVNKYVIWIQGESDAKYGSDIIYYKENLKSIANRLKYECNIDKMFVSLTGYWLGHKDYLIRTRRIAAAQEAACNECDILCVGSKRAMTYHEEKLVIDDVHYSQEGLNILGKDLSNNIFKYQSIKEDLQIEDTINLEKEREYIKFLEEINNKYS